MTTVITMAIGLYLVYVFVATVARGDSTVAEWEIMMEQDRSILREHVIREKYKKALDDMIITFEDSDIDDKAFEEYINILEDDRLLEEAVDEYVKEIRKAIRIRKLTSFLVTFVANIYTLLPALVLLLSGDVYLSIVLSVFLMFASSLFDDYMLRKVTTDLYGEEVSEDVMSYLPTKLKIVFNSVISQAHFYILLWVLL